MEVQPGEQKKASQALLFLLSFLQPQMKSQFLQYTSQAWILLSLVNSVCLRRESGVSRLDSPTFVQGTTPRGRVRHQRLTIP